MLAKILKKEVSLSMHPTMVIMLLLSVMVFIPNYPYSVIFFYTTLALFFTCLLGRENNDVIYSLNLPIGKKDIVKGRIVFSVIEEMLQIVITYICVLLKTILSPEIQNEAGMEANIALIGGAFIIYAIFNWIFFGSYYKNVNNVGKSFVKGTIGVFLAVAVIEASSFIVKDLDTIDPENLGIKIVILLFGIILYILLTLGIYKKSVQNFIKQDIQ